MDPSESRIDLSNEFCSRQYSNSVEYNPTDILPPVTDVEGADNSIGYAALCVVEARQYSNSVEYNPMDILPPVTDVEGADNSIGHAALCVVEARFRKARTRAHPPKSMWRLSLKSLLANLQAVSGRSESFSMHHALLAMGGRGDEDTGAPLRVRGVGENSVAVGGSRAISGVIMHNDYETIGNGQFFSTPTVSISRIDTYELASRCHVELIWEEVSTGERIRFADVVGEIRTNGPVMARLYVDSNFMNWSRESAVSSVYEGLPFVELSEAGREEQLTGKAHHVALIGFGGEGDKGYFIAQNSFGTNWGDGGVFRLSPKTVSHISIPIIQKASHTAYLSVTSSASHSAAYIESMDDRSLKLSPCGTQINDLPSCLIMDILSRLPVSSLLSCRVVCKRWYLIFSDPLFLKLHLERSPTYLARQIPHPFRVLTKLGETPDSVLHGSEFSFANSCNGLLCFVNSSSLDDVFVCNPVLGECITIPIETGVRTWFFLGFSSRSSQFKVLCITRLGYMSEIYTIGDGTGNWKTVGIAPSYPILIAEGCVSSSSFLNGSIHWADCETHQIAYFNFDSEQFGLLSSHPARCEGRPDKVRMCVSDGCLCIYVSELELWVMKEYGVEESWTKTVLTSKLEPIGAPYKASFVSLQDVAKGEQLTVMSRRTILSNYLRTKFDVRICD